MRSRPDHSSARPARPAWNVSQATNATPILITLFFPAAPPTGTTVTITGALGNTAANGVWTASQLPPAPNYLFNLTLNGSVGNGAYTADSALLYIGALVDIWYGVTAIGPDGTESFITTAFTTWATGDATSRVITWTAAPNATSYKVYKGFSSSALGFIGSTAGLEFTDVAGAPGTTGMTPDLTNTAPVPNDPFSGAGNWPAAVGYFQERQVFGGTNNNPETLYGSRTGDYGNFTVSSPLQDDDEVEATLVSRKVNSHPSYRRRRHADRANVWRGMGRQRGPSRHHPTDGSEREELHEARLEYAGPDRD